MTGVINLDWTLPVASLVFLIALFALNQLLFKPVFRVLDERRAKTVDLRHQAQEKLGYQRALLDQYQARVKEERQAGYKLTDSTKAAAVSERQQRLSQARQEAERLVKQAKDDVEAEREAAKALLQRESIEIARLITTRVLQRS